jgi:hypothetical protein
MFAWPENKSAMNDAPLNTLLEFPTGMETMAVGTNSLGFAAR